LPGARSGETIDAMKARTKPPTRDGWTHIGGDLWARFDGRYVDIGVRRTRPWRIESVAFASKGALRNALALPAA
jgi:hypothetical protein